MLTVSQRKEAAIVALYYEGDGRQSLRYLDVHGSIHDGQTFQGGRSSEGWRCEKVQLKGATINLHA